MDLARRTIHIISTESRRKNHISRITNVLHAPWQRDVCKQTTNKKHQTVKTIWIFILMIFVIIFIPFWLRFGAFLVSFGVPFDVFWRPRALFWCPWAPFGRPWAPSRNNDPSGGNWGRIRGPNRSPFWAPFSQFFAKNRFWPGFFDVFFSEAFFYSFLAAPG